MDGLTDRKSLTPPGEALPKLPKDKERIMIRLQKKAYFSDRTLKIIEKFDYTDLPKIDQLIADFFVLNDTARSDLFEYIKTVLLNDVSLTEGTLIEYMSSNQWNIGILKRDPSTRQYGIYDENGKIVISKIHQIEARMR